MPRMQIAAVVAVLAALVVGTMLTACAAPGASPGAVLEVVTDVRYYPACGNETLVLGETTWYPFVPTDPAALPSAAALAPTGGLGGGMSRAVLPAVAAPGPGDDVGTVTVFEGGLAHFLSDSGDLQTWLTTERLEYGWAC